MSGVPEMVKELRAVDGLENEIELWLILLVWACRE